MKTSFWSKMPLSWLVLDYRYRLFIIKLHNPWPGRSFIQVKASRVALLHLPHVVWENDKVLIWKDQSSCSIILQDPTDNAVFQGIEETSVEGEKRLLREHKLTGRCGHGFWHGLKRDQLVSNGLHGRWKFRGGSRDLSGACCRLFGDHHNVLS